MKKCYPILLSKKGEIVALQYLAQNVKDEISPVIEIVQASIEKKEKQKSGPPKIVYKEDLEAFLKTHWSFFGNQIVFDFSLFPNIATKIDDVEKLIISLLKSGVNIIPAIQINSNSEYVKLVKTLIREYRVNVCFRTSEGSGGFDNFKDETTKLMQEISVADPARILLLLDLGYATKDKVNIFGTIGKMSIRSLPHQVSKWLDVVLASSSFPENLGQLRVSSNCHLLPRHEWTIWNNVKKEVDLGDVKYGDFGTKHPFFEEANFAGTISIKYTTEENFLVFKGVKTEEHHDGHGQYITHCQKLTKMQEYSGKDFSWGDLRIHEISLENIKDDERKTGSSTTWVQISQNHHVTLLHHLL